MPKPVFLIPVVAGLLFSGCTTVVENQGQGTYRGVAVEANDGPGYDENADAPAGEPDYVYGDVNYYFIGGRYYYFRHHRRYYIAHLPAGGKYHHHHDGHWNDGHDHHDGHDGHWNDGHDHHDGHWNDGHGKPNDPHHPHDDHHSGGYHNPNDHHNQQYKGPVQQHHFVPEKKNEPQNKDKKKKDN